MVDLENLACSHVQANGTLDGIPENIIVEMRNIILSFYHNLLYTDAGLWDGWVNKQTPALV